MAARRDLRSSDRRDGGVVLGGARPGREAAAAHHRLRRPGSRRPVHREGGGDVGGALRRCPDGAVVDRQRDVRLGARRPGRCARSGVRRPHPDRLRPRVVRRCRTDRHRRRLRAARRRARRDRSARRADDRAGRGSRASLAPVDLCGGNKWPGADPRPIVRRTPVCGRRSPSRTARRSTWSSRRRAGVSAAHRYARCGSGRPAGRRTGAATGPARSAARRRCSRTSSRRRIHWRPISHAMASTTAPAIRNGAATEHEPEHEDHADERVPPTREGVGDAVVGRRGPNSAGAR